MRLKYIEIENYKNLKNFKLRLNGENFIDVFVGKNGTGKSNLLEAILNIFRELFENKNEISFDYQIHYEIDEHTVEVKWEAGKLSYNGQEGKKVPKDMLPDNILTYYSGHNTIVSDLVSDYERKFKEKIKGANVGDSRKFIGIGKDYKSILLSVMLLQPNDNKAKKYVLEKFGLNSISNEVKITLQRPDYAKKKGYDVDRFDDKTRFWRAEGITQTFLDKLNSVKKGDSKGRARDEGYIAGEGYQDEYVIYLDIIDFQAKFSDTSSQQLFQAFDNLKIIEMLKDVSIEIELQDGSIIDLNQFSDGQFQSIYIYSIIELFKERNCITLLDEPDSFLHPEWQHDFLKQISKITKEFDVSNHVLMTSHSAVTLTSLSTPNLFLFTKENKIKCHKSSKYEIIKTLSSGLISLTENEANLNINHFLNNTSQAVLFTEGITDEIILKTAWDKLNPGLKPNFEIQNAFSCGFLRNLLKDQTLYEKDTSRKYFALFDFDEAYNEWNSVKGDSIEEDPHKGLCKKMRDRNGYAILLPVPTIESISRQVINPNTHGNYGTKSLLTIELLFSHLPELNIHFTTDVNRTDGFKKFIGKKVNFAKNIVPTIASEHFEIFRPMFDFIRATIAMETTD